MPGDWILIVGIGNVLRRDDGAGPLLAEALRSALSAQGRAVQLWQVQQLLPEMAEEIAEVWPRLLVFVDCAAGDVSGSILKLDPAAGSHLSPGGGSHTLTSVQLLALARRLYQFEGDAWLVTVPGSDFAHGEGVSPTTRAAIHRLVPHVVEHLW